MLSNRLKTCVTFVCGLLLLTTGGCVMSRTVKEDGVVVEKGYVVKGPLQNNITGF